jgi:hypothetical protein
LVWIAVLREVSIERVLKEINIGCYDELTEEDEGRCKTKQKKKDLVTAPDSKQHRLSPLSIYSLNADC